MAIAPNKIKPVVTQPILEKNRKIGNKKINPIGGGTSYLGGSSSFNERTVSPYSSGGPAAIKDPSAPTPPTKGGINPGWQIPVDGRKPPKVTAINPDNTPAPTRNLQVPPPSGGLATPTAQVLDDQSLVSNQLTDLLSDNSKYLQLARSGAAQQANSRGLLNSSIAAGAGEEAAIRNALPIAQQDANTRFQVNTNNANLINRFAENTQQHGFNLERDATNAGYSQDNIILSGEIATRAQQRDHVNQLAQLDKQGFIQSQRDFLLQNFNLTNMDVQQRNNLESIATNFANAQEQYRFQMGAAYQQQFLDASSQNMANWSAEIQSIYQNPDMTPAQQQYAVTSATARYQQIVQTTAAMYRELGAWQVVVEQFPTGSNLAPVGPATPPGSPAPIDAGTGNPNFPDPTPTPPPTIPGSGTLPVVGPSNPIQVPRNVQQPPNLGTAGPISGPAAPIGPPDKIRNQVIQPVKRRDTILR